MTSSPAGLDAFTKGKNISMVQEADFYSAQEAADVLGLPVRQVFGMLCGGELEGHQDNWARWLVPVSAVEHARRNLKPSSDRPPKEEDDVELHIAQNEARFGDTEATILLPAGQALWKPPATGSDLSSGEKTTQEADETPPLGDVLVKDTRTVSSDAATTEIPPHEDYPETTVSGEASNETLRELAERLVAAAEKTRQLRERLKLAEAAEATLRESLKREQERADWGRAQVGQKLTVDRRTEEELRTKRTKGLWRRLFNE